MKSSLIALTFLAAIVSIPCFAQSGLGKVVNAVKAFSETEAGQRTLLKDDPSSQYRIYDSKLLKDGSYVLTLMIQIPSSMACCENGLFAQKKTDGSFQVEITSQTQCRQGNEPGSSADSDQWKQSWQCGSFESWKAELRAYEKLFSN